MSCRPCPAAAAGLSQATALWPNRSTASDGTCGDPAHAARVSDHNPDSRGLAHAFDLTDDPGSGCDAHLQADAIRLRARAGQEPRAKYIISNRRYAGPDTGWQWTVYGGDNPHTMHAHFSVTTSAENDTSPWYDQQEGLTVAEVQQIITAVQNQGQLTRARIAAFEERLNLKLANMDNADDAEIARIKAKLNAALADLATIEAAVT